MAITLDATNEKIVATLDATYGTAADFNASYLDKTSTAVTPGEANGTANGTSETDLVTAPAASTQRSVIYIQITNMHSAAVVATVIKDVGGTNRVLTPNGVSLATKESLCYEHGKGWYVLNASGAIKNTLATIAAGDLPLFTGLTAETALASGDEFPFYDLSASANRKVTLTNLAAGLDGQPWTFADLVNITEEWRVSGVISPAALASNTDNWNPTDLHNVTNVRVDLDASVNLTGMDAGAAGEIKILHNIDASLFLTIKNNVTSTAGNRFMMSSDLTLGPDESAAFWYDTTSARWRPIKSETEQPGFHASRATAQTSFTGAAWNKIRYTAEEWDTHGFFVHDADDSGGATESRFTPLVPGKYLFAAAMYMAAPNDGTQLIPAFYKNGAVHQVIEYGTTSSTNNQGKSGACLISMDGSSDYVEFYAYNGTSSTTMGGDANYVWFSGVRVSA